MRACSKRGKGISRHRAILIAQEIERRLFNDDQTFSTNGEKVKNESINQDSDEVVIKIPTSVIQSNKNEGQRKQISPVRSLCSSCLAVV